MWVETSIVLDKLQFDEPYVTRAGKHALRRRERGAYLPVKLQFIKLSMPTRNVIEPFYIACFSVRSYNVAEDHAFSYITQVLDLDKLHIVVHFEDVSARLC